MIITTNAQSLIATRKMPTTPDLNEADAIDQERH